MKAYLDTVVIQVLLFNRFTLLDQERLPETEALFAAIDQKRLDAVMSLYTLQEIYAFCRNVFPTEIAGRIARRSLGELCIHDIELVGLLSRQQRLAYRQTFPLLDPSDQPHAIAAHLAGCDLIVTYDSHFDSIRNVMEICTPAQILRRLGEDSFAS